MRAAARQAIAEPADDGLNVEVISGVKLMSPRPTPDHASTAGALVTSLTAAFDDHYRGRRSGRPPAGPGGWRILFEPELHLSPDTLIPDLAAWRTRRLAKLPKAAAIAIVPDWGCEVLSPGTARIDRHVKLPAYASAGIPGLWLIDLQACAVEVYRLVESKYSLVATHTGSRRTRIEPFVELPLDLGPLWP